MNYAIKDLLKELKKERQKKNISQSKLASTLDIPQSYLSNIENGKINISLSLFLDLSRALEIEPLLIPRKYVPSILSLLNSQQDKTNHTPFFDLDEENNDE